MEARSSRFLPTPARLRPGAAMVTVEWPNLAEMLDAYAEDHPDATKVRLYVTGTQADDSQVIAEVTLRGDPGTVWRWRPTLTT